MYAYSNSKKPQQENTHADAMGQQEKLFWNSSGPCYPVYNFLQPLLEIRRYCSPPHNIKSKSNEKPTQPYMTYA